MECLAPGATRWLLESILNPPRGARSARTSSLRPRSNNPSFSFSRSLSLSLPRVSAGEIVVEFHIARQIGHCSSKGTTKALQCGGTATTH